MLNITESNTTERLWDYFHEHYDTDDYTNQYVLDVLSLANSFGIVPKWAAIKLFRDHGSSELDYIRDGNQKYNALQILEWLGYWLLINSIHTTLTIYYDHWIYYYSRSHWHDWFIQHCCYLSTRQSYY